MLVSQWNSGSSCFRRQTRKGKESRSFFRGFGLLVFVSVDVSILPKSPPKKKVGNKFQSWKKFPGKNQDTVDDTVSAVFFVEERICLPSHGGMSSMKSCLVCIQHSTAWLD